MLLLQAKKITTTSSFSPFNIATAFSDYNQQKRAHSALGNNLFRSRLFLSICAHKTAACAFALRVSALFAMYSTPYDIYARTSFAYCNHNSAATYKMHPSLAGSPRVGRHKLRSMATIYKIYPHKSERREFVCVCTWGRNTK
jgi:hypothetical protein